MRLGYKKLAVELATEAVLNVRAVDAKEDRRLDYLKGRLKREQRLCREMKCHGKVCTHRERALAYRKRIEAIMAARRDRRWLLGKEAPKWFDAAGVDYDTAISQLRFEGLLPEAATAGGA